jgi:hypothetical protein
VRGHRRAAGVIPQAADAPALAFLPVGVAGRGAAAGQADLRRRQDLARQPRRQEAGEPAGAGAQGHGPAHAAVDAGDGFFQPHDFRQRQLGPPTLRGASMRSQPRSWIRACCAGAQPAIDVGLGCVFGNHCGIVVGSAEIIGMGLKSKRPLHEAAFLRILWLPDLDSNQGPAD